MIDNPILQTAAGLVLVFLGLSLIVTAIQEFIASITKLRALTLSQGLKQMMVRGEQGIQLYLKLMQHPAVTPAGNRPSYIAPEQFSNAILHLLNNGAAIPAKIQDLERSVMNSPDTPFNSVLMSLFRDGETAIQPFEKRLQLWFDQSMDRVSGTYKRWSQYISIVIGCLLAILLRADAIAIAGRLWSEPYLRSEVAKSAAALTKTSAGAAATLPDISQIAPTLVLLQPGGALAWHSVLGITITAAAISLGAPFWFDLLQSFVSIRSTGPTPLEAKAANAKGIAN